MGNIEKKKINWAKIAFIIVTVAVYTVFIIKWSAKQYMNSDWGNLILEADDVIHGNFFRSGWTLTSISFLTTDLPYFMIGVLIAGVSRDAFAIGVGLMVLALSGTAVLWMLHGSSRKNLILKTCVILSFAMLHPYWSVYAMKAHGGAFVYSMIVFNIHERCREKNSFDKAKAWIIILSALAFMGDALFCMMTTMPIIIWTGVKWLKKEFTHKDAVIWGLTAMGGIPLGIVISKLYYAIGGCDINGFKMRSAVFTPMENLQSNFTGYFKALFMIGGGDYFGHKVMYYDTPAVLVNAAVIILFFILSIYHIVCFLIGKKYEYASLMAGMGFLVLSAAYTMTGKNAAEGIMHVRYISVFLPAAAVVIFRNIDFFMSEKTERLYLIFLCCGLVSVAGRVYIRYRRAVWKAEMNVNTSI
ncbi:MAG: hypothetical protein K6G19_08330 [Lachnospiraceae bacterium]|nr:hypothetical protein [Lachnospiraceae bacterium]